MTRRAVLVRCALALSTLVFVLCFNFFLLRAVGDPKQDLARNPRLDVAAQQAIIRERGLDRGQLTQFRIYLTDTLQGDLGDSFATRRASPPSWAGRCPTHCCWSGSRPRWRPCWGRCWA